MRSFTISKIIEIKTFIEMKKKVEQIYNKERISRREDTEYLESEVSEVKGMVGELKIMSPY